jgi:hypothetical protein
MSMTWIATSDKLSESPTAYCHIDSETKYQVQVEVISFGPIATVGDSVTHYIYV